MKFHFPHKVNKLTKKLEPYEKLIFTTAGTFKRRKNGRIIMKIDGGVNEEILRVTPISPPKGS